MSISEEDIFKAEVLGYMPEECLNSIGLALIQKAARENPERLANTIEEIVSKHEDSPAITWLFRHLLIGYNDALFRSSAVTRWIKKNEAPGVGDP